MAARSLPGAFGGYRPGWLPAWLVAAWLVAGLSDYLLAIGWLATSWLPASWLPLGFLGAGCLVALQYFDLPWNPPMQDATMAGNFRNASKTELTDPLERNVPESLKPPLDNRKAVEAGSSPPKKMQQLSHAAADEPCWNERAFGPNSKKIPLNMGMCQASRTHAGNILLSKGGDNMVGGKRVP